MNTKAFGTMKDVEAADHEWVTHSMHPKTVEDKDMRVTIGGSACSQPYSASLLNISAMSYGSLGKNAIKALNKGALEGGFYHNTGEGGISEYHLQGADLVWQIGTAYFGCRTQAGDFCPDAFKESARLKEVKMIEIKLSQGAKPGKGGILPGEKVTPQIAKIRGVKAGETIVSPPGYTAFKTNKEMLLFIDQLRQLSGAKPIGIKFCIGRKSEFVALCTTMVEMGITPDFITVDGGEGGTGAAPLEFINSVGMPLVDGLTFVRDCLVGFNLKKEIKIIAAGKIFTAFHVLRTLSLGADVVNSARGMMLALGCIHALTCNTNKCPAGVATTDPELNRGLVVQDKYIRVSRYHKATIHAFAQILGAMGYDKPEQVKRADVYRRLTDSKVKTFAQVYPKVATGALLEDQTTPEHFKPYLLEAGQLAS